MPIIKLNAIGSTNTYLRELINTSMPKDYTVVMAKNQTNGRGQMGTHWVTQEGKNLTISVFKDTRAFYMKHPFGISMVVALALVKTLEHFSVPKIKIKWPNDILSDNKKICGILIENVIKKNKLIASIIGIGLNVNQTEFTNLPRASSLRLITGRTYDIDEILYIFLEHLKPYFEQLIQKDYSGLKIAFEANLFRKNKPSTFKDTEGNMFTGIIKSVTDSGSLQVLLEDDIVKAYDIKEVVLMH